MHTTKLARWGNSQGVIIPKHLCEHVGMKVGDRVEIAVDAASGTIEVAPATSASEQRDRGCSLRSEASALPGRYLGEEASAV